MATNITIYKHPNKAVIVILSFKYHVCFMVCRIKDEFFQDILSFTIYSVNNNLSQSNLLSFVHVQHITLFRNVFNE